MHLNHQQRGKFRLCSDAQKGLRTFPYHLRMSQTTLQSVTSYDVIINVLSLSGYDLTVSVCKAGGSRKVQGYKEELENHLKGEKLAELWIALLGAHRDSCTTSVP